MKSPAVLRQECNFGKWKIFRSFANHELDKTWHEIREATKAGVLADITLGVRCTTMFYNPTHRAGPCISGVISVFTTEENVGKAGRALINLVQHDIEYKTQYSRKQSQALHKYFYWNLMVSLSHLLPQ